LVGDGFACTDQVVAQRLNANFSNCAIKIDIVFQQKISAKHSLFYEAFSLLIQQKIAPSALDFKRSSGLPFTWHVDPVL